MAFEDFKPISTNIYSFVHKILLWISIIFLIYLNIYFKNIEKYLDTIQNHYLSCSFFRRILISNKEN